ncbi:MAG: efflux RND transporter permease subunit [Gemmataceae bacterium]
MLNALIRLSLRYRPAIVALSLAVLLAGGYLATTMPVDVFPDLDRPRVTLMTEAHGMAAEEVETLVTFPLESALLGATGVQNVRSESVAGLSTVTAQFDWATDVRDARQAVKERVDTAIAVLPPGIRPEMAPVSSVLGQIVVAGLDRRGPSKPDDELEMRTLADWVVRPRLLKVPGVAQVTVVGGGRKQYQVCVDPLALQEYGIGLKTVEDALRRNNANATGGIAERGDLELPVRVIGRLGPDRQSVISQLQTIPVKPSAKRTVPLGQVARVTEGAQLKRGDASIDGRPGVMLTITKQPHADTRAVTEGIDTALRELAPSLPKGIDVRPDLFRLRGFIDRAVANVGEALRDGAVLVLIVLFLFLLNVRTTLISLAAIPLSLALTVLTFKLIGRITGTELSINVMTLGGIAVAMGELVDDAIVDVENIFRRLRENPDKSPLRVVYEASREIRSAIVFGTAVVVLVFLPLFALEGMEGRLFAPLGLAYIVSILMSLLVSLTVTPVLSYYLLVGSKAVHRPRDGFLLRWLKALARPLVRFSMAFAGTILVVTWVTVAFSGWLLTQLGADFLPPFDEGSVQVNVTLPSGSSIQASGRAAALADAAMQAMLKTDANPNGELLHFVRRSGRAELDEHADPPNVTETVAAVNLECGLSREDVVRRLLKNVGDAVPGADVEVEQPLAHLISETLSGVKAQIAIKIFGDDLRQLERLAGLVRSEAAKVPGVTPPVVEPLELVDELHVRPRAHDLAFYGVDRSFVAEFVQTALQGEVVSQIVEGQKRFDLVVRLDDPYRADPAQLGRLRLELPEGRGQVMLNDLADIGPGEGANELKRENARRRIVVRCNALGRDLQSVVGEIRARCDALPRLEGYTIEYGGQFESQRRATLAISWLSAISCAGIFVVLYLLFPSARIVLQILHALPVAFIGGVLALALTHQTLTVAGMVGFVSLGGIAVRNGILLVTHYVHLMKYEGEGFTSEMVMRGSLERLAPVLMTALTAGIGLLPLVLGGQQPGREILYPVATVILGGLVTSTFCEFLLHPGLFWRFSGTDAQRLARTTDESLEGVEA